jgi:hypothetical protein
VLDEYSRKAINWLISWNQTVEEARRFLEGALISENILDLPEDQRPEIINDRENPFVESAFSTIKTAPEYPARFQDCQEAQKYFDQFFAW